MVESVDQAVILLCDDDPHNLEVVLRIFQDKPHKVLYAPNGQVGCTIARKEIPHLIITDWSMPVMDGLELIQELSTDELTRNIPIVVGTGVMTDSADLKRALETGATDYIRKPFDPVELTSRVNAALRLAASIQKIMDQNEEIRTLMAKEQELVQERLQRKERELATAAMHAFEKNKILQEMAEELRSVEDAPATAVVDRTKAIIKRIDGELNKENTWDELKLHFESVNPRFFEKLKGKFNELTPNDLKTCAYLKMGLRNKEIAHLTNVSVPTVKKAINRLKKKINLAVDDDLRQFIMLIDSDG